MRWATLTQAERIAASARWRAAHLGHLDLAYAPGDRTKWDLFPAADHAAPCLVFIHGGWWQFGARQENAIAAAGVAAHGWSAALPGYTLAPAARLSDNERRDHPRARLARDQRPGARYRRAGVARWMVRRRAPRHPGAPASGCPRRAGLFGRLSPLCLPTTAKPLSVAVGADEPPALRRDARAAHPARRADPIGRLLELHGLNHFTIYHELTRPYGALVREVLRLAAHVQG